MRYALWVAGGIAAILATVIVINMLSTAGMVMTAPGRVIQKTLGTENIINNYEWFHRSHGVILSRVAQIRGHRELMADAVDVERQRLRIELAGMQQSCRDLANQYNAHATMSNRSIFMGREAPASIDANVCE